MGFLTKLLTFPVSGPINGVVWLAGKIEEQANIELYDPDRIQAELAELEMRFDMDEISEAEFIATEDDLLERLQIGRKMRQDGEL